MGIWDRAAEMAKTPKVSPAPTPKISTSPTKSPISTKGMYKAPGSVLGEQPPVRDGIIRGNAPAFNPWNTINPTVAAQLQNKGVKIVPGLEMGAIESQNAMRFRSYRAPTAYFNPTTNQIRYNQYMPSGGLTGVMQHELVHAATANLNPLQLGAPFSPKLGITHGLLRAQMRAPGFRGQAFVAPFNKSFFSLTEGIADRSAYPDIPKWGDRVRNYIVPNPQ